ncbi:MAG: sel1 repeat family protein [Bacilli bacterium]|nr:sel1 repeat family protein [Bacilli bacterium]
MDEIDLIKYQKLALLNNEDAIFMLASHYQDKGNYVRAFSYLTRIINTDKPTYLRKIGYFFEKGLGVDVNKEKAFEYYLKSAKCGDYISQYNVAVCYMNGVGVEKDEKKAFNFAYESAVQNYDKSLFLLANMYRIGCGCDKDLNKCMSILRKCNSDNADVLYLRSLLLLDNNFEKCNPKLAIDLLKKGSFNNNPKCLVLLADLYRSGKVVDQDNSKSLSLLLKAAKKGSSGAMNRLAEYYEKGIGTLKNEEISQFWKAEALKKSV